MQNVSFSTFVAKNRSAPRKIENTILAELDHDWYLIVFLSTLFLNHLLKLKEIWQ